MTKGRQDTDQGTGRNIMNKAIHKKLMEVAHLQTTISYSELAPLADLDMSRDNDRAEIGRILGEVSVHEHEEGRPMLSAVVTHKDGDPGKGFYTLARELGVMAWRIDKLAFWSQELRKVHDYWSTHTP